MAVTPGAHNTIPLSVVVVIVIVVADIVVVLQGFENIKEQRGLYA